MSKLAESIAKKMPKPGEEMPEEEVTIEEESDGNEEADNQAAEENAMKEFKRTLNGNDTKTQVDAFRKLLDICMGSY